jgi:hypothetical protein
MQDAGELTMQQARKLFFPMWLLACGAAPAADDCAIRMPLSNLVPELSRGCPEEKAAMEKKARECIPISGALPTNAYSKIDIREPGHYCLTEDLHARIEFADRPAEGAMITIWTSNVVLDLQGHTLGRGKVFKNPGGEGIKIASDKYNNILIKNGTLRDFEIGVYRYDYPTTDEVPLYDAKNYTYTFSIANVVLENLTFTNNKKNFQVRIPYEAKP